MHYYFFLFLNIFTAEFDGVKYAAYRTALKVQHIQKHLQCKLA